MRESRRMRALRAIVLAPALVVLSAGAAIAQTPVDPSVTPRAQHGRLGPWDGDPARHPRARRDPAPGGRLRAVRPPVLHGRVQPEGGPRRPRAARPGAPTSHGGYQGSRARDRRAAAVATTGRRRRRSCCRPRRTRCRRPPHPPPAAPAAPAPRRPAPTGRRGSPAAAPLRATPAARRAGAASPAAPAAPAPAAAVPHAEVSLDQEVFDATLKELLDKGTDKRVAEGQARRAAMIAARKKAAGEA